ncbi:hypothetical protein [Pedobacter sp. UYP24]
MKTKILVRYISYVLLIAMQFAVLPIQQIFHHHLSTTSTESKTPILKKYERSCCEQFKVIISTAVQDQSPIIAHQQHSVNYLIPSIPYSFLADLQLANKAPPVA